MSAPVRTVSSDMGNSTKQWMEIVWPHLGPKIGGGVYLPMEGVKSPLPMALDMQCGIDGIQLPLYGEPIAWATRVQKCSPSGGFATSGYDTFTIRSFRDSGAKTELEKRIEDTRDVDRTEGPRPLRSGLTGHAYIDDGGNFLSCGVICTVDLNRYLRFGQRFIRSNRTNNAGFVYVGWRLIEMTFYEVMGYTPRVFMVGRANGQWDMPFGQECKTLWEAYR